MYQFGFELLVRLAFALALASALIALPLAIAITLALNRLFRSRVGRSMRATGSTAVHPEIYQPSPDVPQGELEIESTAPTPERVKAARSVPLLAEVRRLTRRLAGIYVAASGAYPLLLAAVFMVSFSAIDFSPTRNAILGLALAYSWSVLLFGTPGALAPTVVLKKQPRFLILAVVTMVVAMWAWGRSVGRDLIGLWLMIAGVPTGATLLLNTRHLRAIGPIVFAATLLALYGFGGGAIFGAIMEHWLCWMRLARCDLCEKASRRFLCSMPALRISPGCRTFPATKCGLRSQHSYPTPAASFAFQPLAP